MPLNRNVEYVIVKGKDHKLVEEMKKGLCMVQYVYLLPPAKEIKHLIIRPFHQVEHH